MSTTEITTKNTSINPKPAKLTKEESMLRSYNETFYSSLKGLSFIKDPLPLEEKLMYHFEQNDSASVSSTIGQLESTLQELLVKNKEIKLNMEELGNEIKQLKIDINKVTENYKIYRPQIKILSDAIKAFVDKQKNENYRLKEEITILEKEKTEIQQGIYDALGYMNKLEKIVGIKSKTYTYYYDQTMSESELSSKFIIKDEDI
jgi:chromosome segregation ATPase